VSERAVKVCAHGDCPHAVPCPDHPKVAFEGSTRSARLPKNWHRIRRRILRRDIVCQVCLNRPAIEVDHITPGDDHSPENLQGICTDCHRSKTAREANAARNAR
jgi:5-methylcytosine-specific restriction endonuclease McrA